MASYVHLENKITFSIIYSNLFLLNLQMCQIILTHPAHKKSNFKINKKISYSVTMINLLVYIQYFTPWSYVLMF